MNQINRNMLPQNTQRESGIELFRCLLMYMIIFLHMLIHGVNGEIVSFRNGQSYETTLLESFFCILCMVSVNCYVMISGYFGIKINGKKILKNYLPVLFYSFFIALIFFFAKKINFIELVKNCFPILRVSYWFATCYLFLCLVSPALNLIVEKYYKNKFFYFLIGIFLLITWTPRIAGQLKSVLGLNSLGFSQIIISYLLGRSVSFIEHDENIDFRLKKLFNQRKLFDLLSFFCCSSITFLMTCVLYFLTRKNYWFPLSAYSSPLTVLASIYLFQFFRKIKLGSIKWLNSFGAATFGIYLLHENPYMRPFIYSFFHAYDFKFSLILIPYVLICSFAILITGGGIDIIRQFLFLKIENITKEIKK